MSNTSTKVPAHEECLVGDWGGRMKNYDESRTEENHLELPGFQHMLCVDEVRGSGRWLAVLSIMNGGAKEGSYSSAMISPEDAEQLIKFLNNLLG